MMLAKIVMNSDCTLTAHGLCTVRMSSKEVNEPVIDAVRQFHLRLLAKKLTVLHGIERLRKVDNINDYVRV